ncbi:hypothetical protein HLH10_04965 [Acinetobacter sp. ANC 4277]|uniref:hypothetical protein n=1 Tax=Acinetobacter terrae TaxID=2731247 RepID=UPI00148F51CF|nr:hypothetical protein [Acinetobacter terrae]NNG75685.1 hypothetical protein [Acinetobacter terrae]
MATINLSWKQKGLADSFNIYRSTSTIDINNLPNPITNVTTQYYSDAALESGPAYYYRVESIRNNEHAISDELVVYTAQPWTPDSLLNKVFWLDGDHVVTSGSNITQMTDRSGNAKNFINNTGLNLPTITLDTSLNRNVVKLASSKLFNVGLSSSYAGASGYYIFCVYRNENTTAEANPTIFNMPFNSDYNMCWMMSGGNTHEKSPWAFFYDSASSSAKVMTPSIAAINQTGANWTMCLFHVDHTNKTSFAQLDGDPSKKVVANASIFSSVIPTYSPAVNGTIGSLTTSSGVFRPIAGRIASIISAKSVLTQTDIDKLFGWAAHEYGLLTLLPSSHPYKINAPTV